MRVTPIPQGGHDSLYDIVATAKVDITNVGDVAAAEVAQLYVGIPGSDAPKVLRGFEKLLLQPGENGAASFSLRRKDLSIWDVVQQQWVLNRGSYNLMFGKSVMDIVATTTLDL
jgi:beta-glucosidase